MSQYVELFGKFYEVPQSFKKFVKFLQSLGRFAPGMAAMAHCLIIGVAPKVTVCGVVREVL